MEKNYTPKFHVPLGYDSHPQIDILEIDFDSGLESDLEASWPSF